MTCLSCDDEDGRGWDRMRGCINGTIYGTCDDERCGGFCEDMGECGCDCHDTIHRDANRTAHHDAHDPAQG